ncbi:Leucyl/phenylalanyl-tRNA--protein transferase [Methylobacterium tardum]|jgi:leucyl/phenylalanyl-tRNA---protein transferase|uniref:Leucyl/phenylalanyl-tRNA--protein transferase n=1 Tax=Methylobacterium tardum TaxID=374432 RepID=A0AA37TFC5_9HYPH|nr:leucyl/phenylalanyl-tRNA--protein transferase [Methylobacterium tardum]URD37238.1 leucyl/phenylalanyl-tRNA--protein transferase [Methylobacterium tardum]GJE51945.1 Leucyl/phenylalanyl-tRNA--protein transferase [Methylobacterium tardum]GLS70882.1 leucyl/phenylalanyl-tRNA--protein transferase [Methylobacterium tardum]
MHDPTRVDITPEILLKAYAAGIFPMAEDAQDPTLYWVEPKARGVLPLDGFRVSRRLARTVRLDQFEVRCDTDFAGVIDGCAAPRRDSERTWINGRIRELYGALYDLGYVHTVEVYAGGRLVGGLYGVSLGAAFFGESMFHEVRDASKVALVHLMGRLRAGHYRLADTQFVTEHLTQFGAEELPRHVYKRRLAEALDQAGDWNVWPGDGSVTGGQVLDALGGT